MKENYSRQEQLAFTEKTRQLRKLLNKAEEIYPGIQLTNRNPNTWVYAFFLSLILFALLIYYGGIEINDVFWVKAFSFFITLLIIWLMKIVQLRKRADYSEMYSSIVEKIDSFELRDDYHVSEFDLDQAELLLRKAMILRNWNHLYFAVTVFLSLATFLIIFLF